MPNNKPAEKGKILPGASTKTPRGPYFSDVHLLTVIAGNHSYTQTAHSLGLSKATVSQRISALERSLGVALVQRTTRSVALTAAGQQLVSEASPAFSRIASSLEAVRDLAETPRGLIRLSAPVALGRQHVVPHLAAFLGRHPEIRIELNLDDRISQLVQDGFDLAVRHAHEAPENCVAWTLCETRAMLVASPAYLARRGRPAHPLDLTGHDCLLYLRERSNASVWTFVSRSRGEADTAPVSVALGGPLKANNSEALRQAAEAGLGIAMLPDFSVGAHGSTAALLPVLPQWQAQGFFGSRILAVRPFSPVVPKAVSLLVRHLQQAFRAGF